MGRQKNTEPVITSVQLLSFFSSIGRCLLYKFKEAEIKDTQATMYCFHLSQQLGQNE